MNGIFFLIITIVLETLAVTLTKLSNGTEKKIFFLLALLAFFVSFLSLSQAFKTLEIGRANAIWAGASTILVYIVGVLFFKETINWQQIFFITLVIVGIIGLHLDAKT